MDTGLMSKSKKRENKKTFDFIVDCLHSPTELICLQKWTLQQMNGGGGQPAHPHPLFGFAERED